MYVFHIFYSIQRYMFVIQTHNAPARPSSTAPSRRHALRLLPPPFAPLDAAPLEDHYAAAGISTSIMVAIVIMVSAPFVDGKRLAVAREHDIMDDP